MIRIATSADGGAERAYDVCVIGGGPAGITLALELARRKRRVCLLEAGGEAYDARAQASFEGDVVGRYPSLRSTRMSMLGGSSQVWAGWCRPLDDEDFRDRPWMGAPGWPLTRDELLPFYRRAHDACGLGTFEYDPGFWLQHLGMVPLPGRNADLRHAMFHTRALHFGREYRSRLQQADEIDVLLHAPVLALRMDDDGSVRSALVRIRSGEEIPIRARSYVLAAGGIENARLLLLSAADPARAPGNERGFVGRFFSDHPFVNPGWLVLREPHPLGFYFPTPIAPGAPAGVRAVLTLQRELIERRRLPASALFFHPAYEAHAAFDEPSVRAFLEWRDTLRSRAVPGTARTLLARALRGPHHVAIAALRKLLVRAGARKRWRVRMMFETASRFDNRITLDSARDALGRPRARLTWTIGEDEITGMRESFTLFDAELRRSGVGHLETTLPDREAWRTRLEGGKHHMGTTRMHDHPDHGVVDAHCRVHGTHNLHVAGSSVFPGGGYANPTLTIVALALRLADHLAE